MNMRLIVFTFTLPTMICSMESLASPITNAHHALLSSPTSGNSLNPNSHSSGETPVTISIRESIHPDEHQPNSLESSTKQKCIINLMGFSALGMAFLFGYEVCKNS